MSRPCQKGELVESASSSGSQERIAARDRDGLVAGGEPDVRVQAEDHLALTDPLHLLDQLAVALLVGHLLVLVACERMRAGREHAGAALGRGVRDPSAQLARLLDRLGDGAVDVRRHLERRAQQLGLHLDGVPDLLLDLVEARDEVEARLVDELELLLDADRERRPFAEVDLHPPPFARARTVPNGVRARRRARASARPRPGRRPCGGRSPRAGRGRSDRPRSSARPDGRGRGR